VVHSRPAEPGDASEARLRGYVDETEAGCRIFGDCADGSERSGEKGQDGDREDAAWPESKHSV